MGLKTRKTKSSQKGCAGHSPRIFFLTALGSATFVFWVIFSDCSGFFFLTALGFAFVLHPYLGVITGGGSYKRRHCMVGWSFNLFYIHFTSHARACSSYPRCNDSFFGQLVFFGKSCRPIHLKGRGWGEG